MKKLHKLSFIPFFVLLLATHASAQNRLCLQIFSQQQSFNSLIESLVQKAQLTRNYRVHKNLQSRNLPEAARLAKQAGLINLSIEISRALEKILNEDQIKKNGTIEIEDGGSEVFLVEFTSGVKAIFKPDFKYWKNQDKIEYGHYLSDPIAEVYTYKLATIFGLDLVPMTIMRTLEGKVGTLQAFVKRGEEPDTANPTYLKDMSELMAFDFLVRNMDRSYEYRDELLDILNIIYAGDIFWAIDHGLALKSKNAARFRLPNANELPLKNLSFTFIQNLKATNPQIIRRLLKEFPDKEVVREIIERRYELLDELSLQPISYR